MIPLEFLHRTERGEIAEVQGEPGFVSRMAALGLQIGSTVRMVQPGSPCLLEVASGRLCVRLDDLSQVLVRPIPASC